MTSTFNVNWFVKIFEQIAYIQKLELLELEVMVLKLEKEQLVEVESDDRSWWRWNRRIGAGGGGIGGCELVEVESKDRSWWR
ncbi:unnamed protein product [Caenorhabditis nigoni]